MAQPFPDFYVESTNSGKVWRITYYKPQGRPGVVSATEGESDTHDGVSFFKCVLFEARQVRSEVDGRATLKAISRAATHLLLELSACGYAPPGAVDQHVHRFAA